MVVMTLNSEAKYSSGGGGEPRGSSMMSLLLTRQHFMSTIDDLKRKLEGKEKLRDTAKHAVQKKSIAAMPVALVMGTDRDVNHAPLNAPTSVAASAGAPPAEGELSAASASATLAMASRARSRHGL